MKKDFNLLRSYKEHKKATRRLSRKARRNVAIITLLILIAAGAIGYLVYYNDQLMLKITEQENYLSDSDNLKKVAEVNEYDSEIGLWRSLNFEVQELKSTAEAYPQFDSALLEVVAPENYTLTSIAYDRGVLVIDLTCKSSDMPSAYIKALNESGLFAQIDYNGYRDQPVKYSFTVNAIVNSNKGE